MFSITALALEAAHLAAMSNVVHHPHGVLGVSILAYVFLITCTFLKLVMR